MSRRLFIFGWDCADWDVIEEGWRRGMLQNLRSLADGGTRGTVTSTVPPTTAPAWTSFITGAPPEEHGIFGFRNRDPSTYELRTVPGGMRRRATLFKLADDAGYRSALVTVPWTFPPDRLRRGAVVPGWDAPGESFDDCHPPDLAEELGRVITRVPRRSPPRSAPNAYLEHQQANADLRQQISTHLLTHVDPQIFMVVFPEPDQVTHLFWSTPGVPSVLLESYELVDRAMGKILAEHAREDDTVLVVSDHGGGPVSTYIHAGKILADAGLLSFTSHGESASRVARSLKRRLWYRIPPSLRQVALRHIPAATRRRMASTVRDGRIDWSRTKAIPRDHGGGAGLSIDINVRGKFSEGIVETCDYLAVRRQVAELFAGIMDPSTGESVLSAVLTKEELYGDGAPEDAPDVQLVPAPGVATVMGMDLTEPLSRVAVGGHRREAVFVASTDLGLPDPVPIEQVLPRALRACGYRFIDAGASMNRAPATDPVEAGYTEAEAAEMETRLRELGYIE